jgi:hypothetical protein
MTAIGRHQSVVGLHPGREALRHRLLRIAEIADPDLAAIEQRIGKLVAGHVG